MRNAWLVSFIFVVIVSLLKNCDQWIQGTGNGELENIDEEELSAIQTHKNLNPSNRSLSPHPASEPRGESAIATSSSYFLSKIVDIIRNRLRVDNRTVAVQTYLNVGSPVLESFAALPNSGPPLDIEPGPEVPRVLELASKAMTIGAYAVLVFTVVSSFFGYRGIFPKPTPMPEDERKEYAESLKKDWLLYAFLVSGISCQLFITCQYLPSFAKMSVDLKTTESMMSFSLQINWLTKGFSALFCGFFADHVGRKNLMIATAAMQVLGSLTCGLATDINWFLAGRVFQGIAEGGEVLGMMITRDVLDDINQRQQWMIGLMAPSIFLPVLSPSVGGLVSAAVGWRVPFVILAAWGAINGIGINMILRETMLNKVDTRFWNEVYTVASNIHLTTLLLLASVMGMLSASVDSNLSIILVYTYRKTEVSTSLLLGGLVAGYIVGLFVAKALLGAVSILRQLQITVALLTLPMASSFLIAAFETEHMSVFYVNLVLTGAFILVGNLCAGSLFMQPIKEMSGAGSGLKVCIGMVIVSGGAFISRILVRMAVDEPRGLSNWQAGCLLSSVVVFWILFGLNPPEWAYEDTKEKKGEEKKSAGDIPGGTPAGANVLEATYPDAETVQEVKQALR